MRANLLIPALSELATPQPWRTIVNFKPKMSATERDDLWSSLKTAIARCRYAADPNCKYELATSQQRRTTAEGDKPVWKHWRTIVNFEPKICALERDDLWSGWKTAIARCRYAG